MGAVPGVQVPPPITTIFWYERRDLNPHVQWTLGPKPSASANSATLA